MTYNKRMNNVGTTVWIGVILTMWIVGQLQAQVTPKYNQTSVDITRALTRDLFDLNSVPYMEPLVTSVNATSNARFYNSAFVPQKVSRPYFRFGFHAMTGFVREDQKTYTPQLPTEKQSIETQVGRYLRLGTSGIEITDTTGLAVLITKRLFQKGLDSSKVTVPGQAATIFGNITNAGVTINREFLAEQLRNDPEFSAFNLLPKTTQDLLVNAIMQLPTNLTIPPGQNIPRIYALIPQLEIGSLWGTELMVRYIPPLVLDTSIGKFSFWGVALKHSISQYVNKPLFDLAVQVGYQGTRLENTVGVTESKLLSTARFINLNIHASKKFEGICEVYTGLNYEHVDINSSFSYILSQEVQIRLGLLKDTLGRGVRVPEEGYPGDDVVQMSVLKLTSSNIKWTVGVSRQFGPIAIFADYSVSRFNIFTGGIELRL
jgi:hypothetical protein